MLFSTSTAWNYGWMGCLVWCNAFKPQFNNLNLKVTEILSLNGYMWLTMCRRRHLRWQFSAHGCYEFKQNAWGWKQLTAKRGGAEENNYERGTHENRKQRRLMLLLLMKYDFLKLKKKKNFEIHPRATSYYTSVPCGMADGRFGKAQCSNTFIVFMLLLLSCV